MRGLCPETGAGRRAMRNRGWVVVRACCLRPERADALQLALELVAIQGSEGQAEEGPATLFDACQGGVERRIPQGFVAIQGGGIGQAPMGLQRCAEIQRAGFPRGGVANGDDDVRRCAFEGFAALAVQAVGGDAGLFEGRQAARMHPPAGLAAGAACLETRRGQVVEHGFGKNAAATVGRAHEQDSHGMLLPPSPAAVRWPGAGPGPKGSPAGPAGSAGRRP